MNSCRLAKGVVLAGGRGVRLGPLTRTTNKHLLPVCDEPMIVHALRKLVEASIHEILIVTGAGHLGEMKALLGEGSTHGCILHYVGQPRAGGVAEALGLARAFAAGERIAVLLGDNLFETPLRPLIERFERQPRGARIVLKELDAAELTGLGVAEVDGDRIASIEEKPSTPSSRYGVTGIYFFDETVFDNVEKLHPSARGELEITDVIRAYLARGELDFEILDGWWIDAGTPASLARANQLAAGSRIVDAGAPDRTTLSVAPRT